MTDDNMPDRPADLPSGGAPFEHRLRSTFDAEHGALEARRSDYGDIPISTTATPARSWRLRGLALGAVAIVTLAIVGIATLGSDRSGEVIVGAPGGGSTAQVPVITSTLPAATSLAPSTPLPAATPLPPATPPPPTALAPAQVPPALPVTPTPAGVTPPPTRLGVRVAFPRTVPGNSDLEYTEPVVRTIALGDGTAITDGDLVAAVVEEWLAGPTEQELAQGFYRPVELINVSGCGGANFQLDVEAGVATVQLCGDAPSAGIGQDVRRVSSLDATLLPFPAINLVVFLDRDGRCVGDLGSGDACLPAVNNGCAAGTTVADQVFVTPAPADGLAVGDRVWSIDHNFAPDCTTVVIEFGGRASDGTIESAAQVSGGIEVVHDAGVTRVLLPESFVLDESLGAFAETWGPSVDTSVSGAAVLVDAPSGERDYVWISTGSADQPSVSVLSDPARLVLGICCNPTLDTFTAGGFEAGNAYGATGYFVFPPEFGGDGSVRFEGLGTAREAVGGAFVGNRAGDRVPTAEYASPTKLAGRPPQDGSFMVGNPGVSWRPFSVTVSGLEPGDYRIVFSTCDQCDVTEPGPALEFVVPVSS